MCLWVTTAVLGIGTLCAVAGPALGDGGPVGSPMGFPDVVARVRPAVGAVGSYNPRARPPVVFSSSGFFFDPRGYFLTTKHSLDQLAKRRRLSDVRVFLPTRADRRGLAATLVAESEKHDLVILKVAGGPFRALELGDSARAREGQAVGLCGFPLGALRGLHPATSLGIISSIGPIATPALNTRHLDPAAIEALRHPFPVFQLDATAYPGNSGGPLFDARTGKVLGVVNSAFIRQTKEKVVSTGISYAIPIHLARPWMDDALKPKAPEPKAPSGERTKQ